MNSKHRSLIAVVLAACILTLCAVIPVSGEEEPWHASAYILVTTDYQQGWLPLPDTDDDAYDYELRQQAGDGTVMENIIHVTSTGFCVCSANCATQDCVGQGEVTLENLDTRIMGNMVICLPHRLTLELWTWEQILQYSSEQ